jgi:hypothetical protein
LNLLEVTLVLGISVFLHRLMLLGHLFKDLILLWTYLLPVQHLLELIIFISQVHPMLSKPHPQLLHFLMEFLPILSSLLDLLLDEGLLLVSVLIVLP